MSLLLLPGAIVRYSSCWKELHCMISALSLGLHVADRNEYCIQQNEYFWMKVFVCSQLNY